MENIIEKLYEVHLKTSDFPLGAPNKENMDEETELFAFLYENLSDIHKKAFLKYVDLQRVRQGGEMKALYEYGFKTAIQMIIEALKE